MCTPEDAKVLAGQLKACKTEISKMRRQLNTLQKTHESEMKQLHAKLEKYKTQQKEQQQSNTNLFLQNIAPVGYLESCFVEKNGTPRQGSICPNSKAKVSFILKIHKIFIHFFFHLKAENYLWYKPKSHIGGIGSIFARLDNFFVS